MSQTIITTAFETYKAQQEALLQPVELDEFVLAYVPGLDPSLPINRDEGVPVEHIVRIDDVHQSGYVNLNAVVYSITLDTTIGDFEFNWIGLRNKQTGILCAVTHLMPISKYKSITGVQNGNAITRSILMSYVGAQQATGITVDASTWQIDFTARLQGIDEAERLSNRDHYGASMFFEEGFLVSKLGSDYYCQSGLCYIEGVRSILVQDETLAVKPNQLQYVYVDTSWQGHITSIWQATISVVVSDNALTHYTDAAGFQHYVSQVAEIHTDGSVFDLRNVKKDYALEDHSHNDYALKSHIHENYADNDHTHDDYAESTHKHNASDINAGILAQERLPTASVGVKGAVPLSNSYVGTSQTKAVTEKALSEGLEAMGAKKYKMVSMVGNGMVPKTYTPDSGDTGRYAYGILVNDAAMGSTGIIRINAKAGQWCKFHYIMMGQYATAILITKLIIDGTVVSQGQNLGFDRAEEASRDNSFNLLMTMYWTSIEIHWKAAESSSSYNDILAGWSDYEVGS